MSQFDALEILIVEDNPNDAELMTRAFKKHNLGNNLIVVEDGAEALEFLFGRGKFAQRNPMNQPKVILLDVKLPKVSGFEVLQEIRADSRTRTVPVVMMTSSHEDPDVRKAYELGANSCVVKPVEFDAFVQATSRIGLYWLLVNRPPS